MADKRDIHVMVKTETVEKLDLHAKQMQASGAGKVTRSDLVQLALDEYFAKTSLKIQ